MILQYSPQFNNAKIMIFRSISPVPLYIKQHVIMYHAHHITAVAVDPALAGAPIVISRLVEKKWHLAFYCVHDDVSLT